MLGKRSATELVPRSLYSLAYLCTALILVWFEMAQGMYIYHISIGKILFEAVLVEDLQIGSGREISKALNFSGCEL